MIPNVVVVLDSNAMLSALKSSTGASFEVIRRLRSGAFTPPVTAPLVFEYQDVLSRRALLPHLGQADIEGFIDWFVSLSSLHKVHFLWRPLLSDPKDDMVLEAAMASAADHLVTYNLSDFRPAAKLGLSVLTPAGLLSKLPPSPP
ncbi:putative toxin-antitoxin system toxin component, PIN family [Luteolibacter arcticus]|uniref:Toxin-antitoxin system toxin component, PIN family n=1 Tax=Luteolibacter arcticus TaxID=1581411 RepID=A0ABT3GFD6_9BACT|nr:putative toxin-antitoxin system toxin component, PIN family [Luteolibacter arcticus]MCW1922330.1 putative toxin-antitoxin system toxin component, PIN family [Luteolibacter arcticus]